MSSIAPSDSISTVAETKPEGMLLLQGPASNPAPAPDTSQDGLIPCACTDTKFLFANENTVVVLDHQTLQPVRIFREHRWHVRGISIDVHSSGTALLVSSVDSERKVIIWELDTGRVVGQFMPYDGIDITVPVWMRDGRHILFGNHSGDVISFDSKTKEHISRATIHVRITAMALAEDNTTLAIGYEEGSILIVNIAHPKLTILHNMPSSGGSSIIGLAWHNSSMKQESIMLASQKQDGGLRLWSIPKRPSADGRSTPRTIRNLVRHGDHGTGPRWFGWSKSGRIAEYFQGQVYIWDVRTTNVTFVTIKLDHLKAITNHGPMALLFTFTPDMKVNKYSINPLEGPRILGSKTFSTHELAGVQNANSFVGESRSGWDYRSNKNDLPLRNGQLDYVGPSPGGNQLASKNPSTPFAFYNDPSKSSGGNGSIVSASSRGGGTGTYISSAAPSTFAPSAYTIPRVPSRTQDYKSIRMTPKIQEEDLVKDLFPYIRASLSEVQFVPPQSDRTSTVADLPRIILKVIFGWESDIRSLLREEFDHQPLGSPTTEILLQWFTAGTRSKSTLFNKVKAIVGSSSEATDSLFQKLVDAGDYHSAVAILLTIGQYDAAIDTYVSIRMMMEAVLLVCTLYPQDWERQVQLVRRWGEIAVTQRQHELSMRCFSVTTLDLAQQWPSTPSLASPTTAKNMRLKVVTSFGGQLSHGDETVTATPIGIGPTPIVETALSPVGGRGFFFPRNDRRMIDSLASPIEDTRLYSSRGKSRSRDPSRPSRSRVRAISRDRNISNITISNGPATNVEAYGGNMTPNPVPFRSQPTPPTRNVPGMDAYRVKAIQDYIGHVDDPSGQNSQSGSRTRHGSRQRAPSQQPRTSSKNGGYTQSSGKHSPTSPISMPPSVFSDSINMGDRSRGRTSSKQISGSAARSISRHHRTESERPIRDSSRSPPTIPLVTGSSLSAPEERSQSRQGRRNLSLQIAPNNNQEEAELRSPAESVSRRHELTLSRVSERSEQSPDRGRDEDVVYITGVASIGPQADLPRSLSTPLTKEPPVGLPLNPTVYRGNASSANSSRRPTPLSQERLANYTPSNNRRAVDDQSITFSHNRNNSVPFGGHLQSPPLTAPPYAAIMPIDVPPRLPELQHLNGPPHPTDGATFSLGVIKIGMEDSREGSDRSDNRATPALTDISTSSTNGPVSPTSGPADGGFHRGHKSSGSISGNSQQKSWGIREKIRASSRTRKLSTPNSVGIPATTPSPYDQTTGHAVQYSRQSDEQNGHEHEGHSMIYQNQEASRGQSLNSLVNQSSMTPKSSYVSYPRPHDLVATLNNSNGNSGGLEPLTLSPATYSGK